ncbi:hypothetical protein NXW06_12565 [Bacteroides fragilis]|nr:hypothetical protein NXW06_12565 [Bacteroides fragilis]
MMRKKWKIVGCFFALCASLSFCGSFFAACFICEIATITNLTLSVGVTILGFCFWLVLIFYKVAPKVFPKIPLINNDEFGHYGCFDFRDEWVYKYIDVFKQFDEKRIVIDASNHDKVGVFLTCLLAFVLLALLEMFPFRDGNNNFVDNFLIVYAYTIVLILGIPMLLSPRRTIVFDREKKTITIPRRWLIHKEETIPFQKAVISFGQDALRGIDGVVIANYQHLVGEVSLQFAGRTNGYCFARLIQAYMTEEDLSNYPEFETFRQIQEEININRL